MTSKIKKCEENIKELLLETTLSMIEEQIKINMKEIIFSRLGEFTRKFKLNQEIYMKKYKEIVGEDPNINSNNQTTNSSNNKKDNFLMAEEGNDILKQRDNELNILLKSVNDLAQIFKELQSLINQQGTILDRIDFNIENAASSVKEGHKNLIKADKEMKKNCAKKAIFIMMIIDGFLSILLILKFIV